jgi:hypothetical protein
MARYLRCQHYDGARQLSYSRRSRDDRRQIEGYENMAKTTPFLLRFAKALPDFPCPSLRYDETRQILQVVVNGAWVDAPDADVEIMRESRFTRVRPETHDE